ncbi:MAG TPA: hypothetical protein VGA56_05865 [Opitutaceae bacterium]
MSKTILTVAAPWRVDFPPNLGAPDSIRLDRLISWTIHPDPGVRYFSGTATYTTTFDMPADLIHENTALVLELGRVEEIAGVSVNGSALPGLLWKPPFHADVTSAVRPDVNRLEIKVTNLWPNRLIGDLHRRRPNTIRSRPFSPTPRTRHCSNPACADR